LAFLQRTFENSATRISKLLDDFTASLALLEREEWVLLKKNRDGQGAWSSESSNLNLMRGGQREDWIVTTLDIELGLNSNTWRFGIYSACNGREYKF
jgi:hypothetical protein